MMKPYLVAETQQYGKTLQQFEPVVLNDKICSDKTLDQLHQCLLAVVDSGTARHLKNDYYQIGGKTGTAQLLENGVYGHNYLSSFAGYFPFDNPKYTIVIIVNSPSNGVFYGGAVAAPAFKEISDKVYSHFVNMREPVNAPSAPYTGVQAFAKGYTYDFRQIFNTLKVAEDFDDNEDWIAVSANGKSSEHTPLKTYQYTMPDVRGMGLRDALYLLETYGLHVSVSGAGKVSMQSIPAGTAIQKDNYVLLTLE
jgi:cell division protein FtsI (penicillin-binding protein 3)